MKDIFKENSCTSIDKHDQYITYKVSNRLLISLLRNFITSPDFQRNLNKDKIDTIFKESHDNEFWFKTHGNIILGAIEKEDNKINYYILDGQHRIEALKRCKNIFQINVQLIFFDSMIDMRNYFKSINQNSNFEIEYQTSDDDYINDIKVYIKKELQRDYLGVFCKTTESKGNRYHINEFVNQLDSDVVKMFYEGEEQEFDKGEFLYKTICDINKEALDKFNKLPDKKMYHNAGDKSVLENKFILALKNIEWIDNLLDQDEEILFEPLRVKKPKITKKISNAVWNKYIGRDKANGQCYSCKQKISIQHFECGHLISHKNGGATDIENLRPFCPECNRQLGSSNFQVQIVQIV
jgi:hypothetical protein